MKILKTKIVFMFVAAVAAILGLAFFFGSNDKKPGSSDDSSGFVVGNNSIYVSEQMPGGNITVSVVRLKKAGFVVIHEDISDEPGDILGISSLLSAGETRNLPPITLSRELLDGQTAYAMLHFDNGDGRFDAAADEPALDMVGGTPVMMAVTISEDATEPGIINP